MITQQPYRVINLRLQAMQTLSPTMKRFIFQSPEMQSIQSYAPDQRVKLFFPCAVHPEQTQWIGNDLEWYPHYKNIPEPQRPPMRTYTIREIRAQQQQLDIDFAMHGATGPASSWAESAELGDQLQMAAPNALWQGDGGGFEWQPPAQAKRILLVADETALPALSGIIEELTAADTGAHVDVLIEMPQQQDQKSLETAMSIHPNIHIRWLSREQGSQPGQQLLHQVQALFKPTAVAQPLIEHDEIDVDHQILWFTQQQSEQKFYAWIAAESKAVLSIRRYLSQDCGVEKSSLNCMGYWRLGKVFD